MKEIEYMTQFIGETFSGIISGVTAFGIFVELENGVEGLVHVSRMINDYYEYVEEQFAIIGERTRKAYRLGDEVEVVLVRASVEERNIDFILKDNGIYVEGEENKRGGMRGASQKGTGARRSSKGASAIRLVPAKPPKKAAPIMSRKTAKPKKKKKK